MIQGTMSSAGKSLICAAICRILRQDGYRVSPFKSQNMALNSFITKEGKEMGRAQVMQAEAAMVEPEVCMNPILLKPTTDTGSQVIVNGRAVGNMRATEYFKYKKELVPEILKAYDELSDRYDVIVIEGAGSPAELNLKKDDIVNMGLAKMLKAPVILVGDIDRGGVFAQLIGTVMLLEEEEKNLIKGLIVNKFRGDRSLFKEGEKILEEKSGKRIVGVVPYMDIDLEDEDSLSDKFDKSRKRVKNSDGAKINISVIKLPKMSNYTDFDVFNRYQQVEVNYLENIEELHQPDLLIIPGTKNTISDCEWLKKNGWEREIVKCAGEGIPIFGICGGYQMLGSSIEDRYGVESGMLSEEQLSEEQLPEEMSKQFSHRKISGIGLLPIYTVFEKEKYTRQVKGRLGHVEGIFAELEGMEIEGYEIHMGSSMVDRSAAGTKGESCSDEEKRNWFNVDNVYGTYVHGIFDAGRISEIIVKKLSERKQIVFEKEEKYVDRKQYKEMQYDKLAAQVRENIDMEYLYQIIFGDAAGAGTN